MLPKPPLPKVPPPPQLPAAGELLDQAQLLLDRAAAVPLWVIGTLLGLALVFIVLHRHAQRLLSGLVLCFALVAFALLVVAPGVPGSMAPGLLAILGGGACIGLGLGAPGWATAAASAVLAGGLGAGAAVTIAHVDWWFGGLPFGLLGFFVGLNNHRAWGLWMPPLFSALGLTLAAVRLLGAHDQGAKVPQLAQVPVAGAVFAVLCVLLIALSVEREHRRKKRVAARDRLMSDTNLKAKLEKDRKLFAKHLGDGAGPK